MNTTAKVDRNYVASLAQSFWDALEKNPGRDKKNHSEFIGNLVRQLYKEVNAGKKLEDEAGLDSARFISSFCETVGTWKNVRVDVPSAEDEHMKHYNEYQIIVFDDRNANKLVRIKVPANYQRGYTAHRKIVNVNFFIDPDDRGRAIKATVTVKRKFFLFLNRIEPSIVLEVVQDDLGDKTKPTTELIFKSKRGIIPIPETSLFVDFRKI